MSGTINRNSSLEKVKSRNVILRILFFAAILIASFSFIFVINEKGYSEINNVLADYPKEDDAIKHLSQLRNKVAKLINLQQLEIYSEGEDKTEELEHEANEIYLHLDTLKNLMQDDSYNLERIYDIDSLLDYRKYIFASYLNLHLNNSADVDLSGKAREIERILNRKIITIDTTSRIVVKYDKKIESQIIPPHKEVEPDDDNESKTPEIIKKKKFHWLPAFLRRKDKDDTDEAKKKFHWLPAFLRPKEKSKVEPEIKEVKKEVKEESIKEPKAIEYTPQITTEKKQQIEISIDSLEIEKRDSAIAQLQLSLLRIEANRNKNNLELKNQEILILNTNDLIVTQILSIIKQLEDKQLIIRANQNYISQNLALKSIQVNKIILWAIALLSLFLSIWIILDFLKMMKIRNKLEYARKEAEFHSQAKQNFLANMSHEIRTPLQSIIGYTEILNEKQNNHEIEAINNSSKHLLHIVNEILDYDKVISGKYSFQENTFKVDDIFDEVWDICMSHANSSNIELVNDYQFDHHFLMGDGFRLKQILINLLNNSLKYTQEGCITLEAQTIKNNNNDLIELHFTITDTGIGIPKDKQVSIFNKYEQSSEEHLLKGTGLGLSIVKELIDRQNGTINLQSMENQGTSIQVIIPYKESQEANISTASEQNKTDEYSNLLINANICFIEDDPIIQQLLRTFTKGFIHKITIYDNAEDFLQSPFEDYDCIISDIRLSGQKTGIDLIKEIRGQGFTKPCIAVTAQAMKDEQDEILSAGFDDILVKPFSKQSLKGIILKHNQFHAFHLPHSKINFENISKMTDDLSILNNIKSDFYLHTTKEIAEIRNLNDDDFYENAVTIVHRIAGRLLQIGSTDLGKQWKGLEYQIRDYHITSVSDDSLIQQLNELETEINRWYKDCDLKHYN